MPVTFTAANNAVSASAQDLVSAALREIGVIDATEGLDADDAAWGLEKLQRLTDQMNAQRETIFSVTFAKFSLTPNHGPHTIGPGGDFDIPLRPVQIQAAAFILNDGSSNPVDVPIRIATKDWWAANTLKSQTSSVVTHLYYDPANPLGNLNFWPICTGSGPVRLEYWSSLSQPIAITSTLAFPQGYWDAIVLQLALGLAPSYERTPSPVTVAAMQRALATIYNNNNQPPIIQTDGGMPSTSRGERPDFNFLTGLRD